MREGMMDDCGYRGFEECFRYEDCCKDAYEQGRIDMIIELNARGYLFDTDKYGEIVGRNDEFWIELMKEQNNEPM